MDVPIRVLCVFGALNRGGSETMCMNIYRKLDRSMIQFDFVKHTTEQCSYDDEILSLGGRIYSAPKFTIYNILAYQKWWRKHLEAHPEHQIIHAHYFTIASIYLKICKEYNRVTICHSHIAYPSSSDLKIKFERFLFRRLNNVSDYKFACSKIAGDFLYRGGSYTILNNAIDVSSYVYDAEVATQVRMEFNFNSDDFVIGHVGRFADQKNHIFLLNIFNEIHKKNSRTKLLLVGDGELRQEIEEKASQYGLEDSVLFTGSRADVNRLMMAMDVFVFPSKYEGLGMVLIEAQASGLPCFSSDVVPEEAKISNLISFLSLEESPSWWADHILSMATGDRENMSGVLRESGFDVVETSRWIQKFYESCVAD